MRVEELEDGLVAGLLVLALAETVAFVGEDHVFHGDVVGLDRGNDLVGFHFQHARVVGALQHHQRLVDVAGMEQRADAHQALLVGHRIAEFSVQGRALGFPPGRDAFQRAQPVGHAKDVDADGEGIRAEAERRQRHVAAVAATDDADAAGVDHAGADQHLLALDHVVEIGFAVATVIGGIEALAIAGAAAIVDGIDGIAVVDQILHQRRVVQARLATGATMHPDHRRHLGGRTGAVRQVQDSGDFQPVVAGEAHDFAFDQILNIDGRVQCRHQLTGLAAQIGGP